MSSAHAMPAGDVEVTPELARALLADQYADLADLPIRLAENGWDNVMLRLGEELALRMPRRAVAAFLAAKEQRWMPIVAAGLPLPAPIPLRVGKPASGYPYPWSVVPWLEGAPAGVTPPDADQGEPLAAFLAALHRPAPDDAPTNEFRGVPLAQRAAVFEARVAQSEQLEGALDPVVRRVWAEALAAPIDAPRSWLHGDLHGRNVLVKDGRFSAVIDWGDMAAGDPATDLAAVWMLLPDRAARDKVIGAYRASAATWARARGWAALMAVLLLSVTNNPAMPPMGRAIVARLADS